VSLLEKSFRKRFNIFLTSDLYGPKYVQAIHGRFLIAASAATVIGPTLLLNLRKMSESAAIQGLFFNKDANFFKTNKTTIGLS